MKKIVEFHRNLVELDKIKAISINTYVHSEPKSNFVRIEFKTRKEYIYNPNTKIHELETFDDVLLIEFSNYDSALAHFEEMMGAWQYYIDQEED